MRARKDIGVCKACLARWRREGALCTHGKTPAVGAQEHGIFLDRYVFGHYDCGASALAT